jgi:hypothetical protein
MNFGNTATDAQRAAGRIRNGANWFYWIGGLTVINTAIVLMKGSWNFINGLGITQVFQVLSDSLLGAGSGSRALATGFSAAMAGLFALFGVFAHKRRYWAFIAGITLYFLDTFIFLIGPDWLSLGFHAFALVWLVMGLAAVKQLRDIEKKLAAETAVDEPAAGGGAVN